MSDDSQNVNPGDVAPGPPPAAVAPSAAEDQAVSPSDPDVQSLLDRAEQAIASADSPGDDFESFALPDLAAQPANTERASLDLLHDVELDVRIELGRTQMQLEEVLALCKGSVVALDKMAGDPVDVFVNGRLVARGEILVLNDSFCVRIAELIAGEESG